MRNGFFTVYIVINFISCFFTGKKLLLLLLAYLFKFCQNIFIYIVIRKNLRFFIMLFSLFRKNNSFHECSFHKEITEHSILLHHGGSEGFRAKGYLHAAKMFVIYSCNRKDEPITIVSSTLFKTTDRNMLTIDILDCFPYTR